MGREHLHYPLGQVIETLVHGTSVCAPCPALPNVSSCPSSSSCCCRDSRTWISTSSDADDARVGLHTCVHGRSCYAEHLIRRGRRLGVGACHGGDHGSEQSHVTMTTPGLSCEDEERDDHDPAVIARLLQLQEMPRSAGHVTVPRRASPQSDPLPALPMSCAAIDRSSHSLGPTSPANRGQEKHRLQNGKFGLQQLPADAVD